MDNTKDSKQETQDSALQKEAPKKKRVLQDDPLSSQEASSIMLSGGIQKATDKTGKNVVTESKGESTDKNVSSLKGFLKKDKTNE